MIGMSTTGKDAHFQRASSKPQEYRINLRISDRNFFDDMRIFAHSLGLTLPAWAKATLIREIVRSEEQDIFAQRSIESLLTMQALMEKDHTPTEVLAAKEKARSYIKRVQSRGV